MNPRGMDAFYDAVTAYGCVITGAANPDRDWNLKADVVSSKSSEISQEQFLEDGK